ncbi:MAG: hypothetical protein HRT83_04685 [Hyphomicrobiaceae bacterium]|nr:hypothetical protein [Hyphomicrobiaceae bacterium]
MLNLEHWLRSFSHNSKKSAKIYGTIVEQIRNPIFYVRYGVQDTIVGRYELLVLHIAIILAILRLYEPANGPLSRGIVEAFVTDMDDNMREMGIGDMSVPRQVKKVSAGLLERSRDYIKSLQDNNELVLGSHLVQHLGNNNKELEITGLTRYVIATYNELSKNPKDIAKLVKSFPDPTDYVSKT